MAGLFHIHPHQGPLIPEIGWLSVRPGGMRAPPAGGPATTVSAATSASSTVSEPVAESRAYRHCWGSRDCISSRVIKWGEACTAIAGLHGRLAFTTVLLVFAVLCAVLLTARRLRPVWPRLLGVLLCSLLQPRPLHNFAIGAPRGRCALFACILLQCLVFCRAGRCGPEFPAHSPRSLAPPLSPGGMRKAGATGHPSPYLALLAHKRHLPTPLLNVARRSASAAASQVTLPAPEDESRTAQGSGAEAAGTPSTLPTAYAPAPAPSAPSPLEHIGPVQPSPWTCGELAALQASGDRSLAFGSVAVGFSSMQLASFLCPRVRFATFGDVLSRLPAAARVSICSLLDSPGGFQGSALHCYVDGSYTPASVDAPPPPLCWDGRAFLSCLNPSGSVLWLAVFQSGLTLQLGVFPPLLPSVWHLLPLFG